MGDMGASRVKQGSHEMSHRRPAVKDGFISLRST